MRLRVVVLLAALAFPAAAGTLIDEAGADLAVLVTLSPETEREPALRAFLAEEAEAFAEQTRAEAAEARRGNPAVPVWRLRIEDRDRFASPEFLSVVRTIRIDAGTGATLLVEPVTLDRRGGDFVALDGLLAGPAGGRALEAIAKDLRRLIVDRVHGGTLAPEWRAAVLGATQPDVAVLQAFSLARSTLPGRIGGLAFHFSPGEVAPAAQGAVEVAVPAAVFAAGLRPALAPLFGGEPVRP
jgi:hypothetical protein